MLKICFSNHIKDLFLIKKYNFYLISNYNYILNNFLIKKNAFNFPKKIKKITFNKSPHIDSKAKEQIELCEQKKLFFFFGKLKNVKKIFLIKIFAGCRLVIKTITLSFYRRKT